MDQNRLLKEAQEIAAKYPFYMVRGQLNHLYGYIYQSSDGKTKYAIDVIFDENFPNEPPQIGFRQQVPNLPSEIQLLSLSNWSTDSHVIEIIDELAQIVKKYVEPDSRVKEEESNNSNFEVQQNNQQQNETQIKENIEGQKGIAETSQETSIATEEYITPDLNVYPDDLYAEWNNSQDQLESINDQNIIVEEGTRISENYEQQIIDENVLKTPTYSSEEIVDTAGNLILTTEAALIQQEYAMDFIEGTLGIVEVYLTITLDQTFVIRINFTEYPKRPILEVPEGIKSILGDINESIQILKKWDVSHPPHVVDIIHELESKLWFLTDLETEVNMISGEYKTELVNGILSHLKINLYTYGFKEFGLEIDLSKHPEKPSIKYSKELNELINTPVENLNSYKNWTKGESHCVDIIRESQWLVDKNSRINFELSLLRSAMKDVNYNPNDNSITAKLEGKMKTEGVSFEFKVSLSPDYPMAVPKIELISKLEEQEELKVKLVNQIKTFTASWHQFSYLIDLFNDISKAIFEVSVISCVICHKIECPECNKKISAANPEDQCQVKCPSCERLYHKYCWNTTISSFKKCGFCLRPPPPNMVHID